MNFTTGDYLGLTDAEYSVLSTYEGFPTDSFRELEAGNGTIWVFEGEDDSVFYDFLIDNDLDQYALVYYSYNLSNNLIAGF